MDERSDSLESAAAHAVECFRGLCERVVGMRETLDRSVPREAMERQCARLQRQIDESHAALRRRNARMAEISAERDELRAEVASMRKRLMPEGMEWPKVDGEPVDFKTAYEPSLGVLEAVSIYNNGACEVMSHDGIVKNAKDIHIVKPKVVDADGVEIKPGDTVCGTRDMEPMRVIDTDSDECGFKKIKCEKEGDGFWFYCPDELTHKLPVLAADGEPLREGETVWCVDDSTKFEVSAIDGNIITMTSGRVLNACYLTHQRPVLDADGVPLEVGQTVWDVESGEELKVEELCDVGLVQLLTRDGVSRYVYPDQLTHTKPEPTDSLERIADEIDRLREEIAQHLGDYLYDEDGNDSIQFSMELVAKRCRALAERERGE